MVEIAVHANAAADIAGLYSFSAAHFGQAIADDYLTGLDEALDRLAAFPELGQLQPGIQPPIHAVTYRSHRIYYDFDGNTVLVVRILHHAMNASARLSGAARADNKRDV